MLFRRQKLTSFEVVTLRLSGMHRLNEYEITREGDVARFVRYDLLLGPDGERRIPRVRAERPAAEVLAVLDRCGVMRWDGFHGAHPRGVLDGVMFRFAATVNEGRVIAAAGSQHFPPHFHDLRDYIEATLREAATDDD